MEKNNLLKKATSNTTVTLAIIMVIVAIIFEILIHITRGGSGLVFLSGANLMLIIRSMLYSGIVAFGLTFVMITGNIDLSVGSQLTFLYAMCAWAMIKYNNVWIAIALTIGCGLMCGIVNGLLVGYLDLNSFIVTLGTKSIFSAFARIVSAGTLLVIPDDCDSRFTWMGTKSFGSVSILIIWFVVIAIILGIVLAKTVFGHKLYVVGSNPIVARFSGIKHRLSILLSYGLTGLCAAIAALVTMSNVKSANPAAAAGAEMEIILCVVLGGCAVQGGEGSVWGTIIGVIFFGILDVGLTMVNVSTYIRWIIMGLVMLCVLSYNAQKARRVR